MKTTALSTITLVLALAIPAFAQNAPGVTRVDTKPTSGVAVNAVPKTPRKNLKQFVGIISAIDCKTGQITVETNGGRQIQQQQKPDVKPKKPGTFQLTIKTKLIGTDRKILNCKPTPPSPIPPGPKPPGPVVPVKPKPPGPVVPVKPKPPGLVVPVKPKPPGPVVPGVPDPHAKQKPPVNGKPRVVFKGLAHPCTDCKTVDGLSVGDQVQGFASVNGLVDRMTILKKGPKKPVPIPEPVKREKVQTF